MGDAEKMAEAIIESLVNKEETIEMLQNAMGMLYRFTPEEVGKQYLEVIEA